MPGEVVGRGKTDLKELALSKYESIDVRF